MATGWEIEQHAGGFDIHFDRRIVEYDRDDLDEALDYIRRDRRSERGDHVTLIEADGYRRTLRL